MPKTPRSAERISDTVATKAQDAQIYHLTDCIASGSVDRALVTLRELSMMKYEPVLLCAAVTRQMLRLYSAKLLMQEGRHPDELKTLWGMKSSYPAEKLLTACRTFSPGSLRKSLELCAKADIELKSTALDKSGILEMLLNPYRVVKGSTRMIRINEVIVVEGRYDKNKIKQIFRRARHRNGRIFHILGQGETGFDPAHGGKTGHSDPDRLGPLRLSDPKLPEGAIKSANIRHAYIPDIYGKEKRKTQRSFEGKLGVEGVDDKIIIDAVRAPASVRPKGRRGKNGLRKRICTRPGFSGGRTAPDGEGFLYKKLSLPGTPFRKRVS